MYKSFLSIYFLFCLIACATSTQDTEQSKTADSSAQIADTAHLSTPESLTNSDTTTLNSITTSSENKPISTPKNLPKPIPDKDKPNKTNTQTENKSISIPTPPAANTEAPKIVPVRPPAPPIKSNLPPKAEDKPIPSPIPPKTPKAIVEESSGKKAALSHQLWDELLRKHVSTAGKVNYKGIITDKEKLLEYIEVLNQNPAQPDWDKNKQLAYWINAYNAFTIKLIIDKYPIKSINDVGAKPWDITFINLGTKKYSLNQIENEIIRPQFKEPRIHFALNCAAKSCPKLLNEAFLPEKLAAQLEKQTIAFVNNANANVLAEKKIEISPIFDWYGADFQGGVIPFLNKYANIAIKDNAKISFKEYDWSLNE